MALPARAPAMSMTVEEFLAHSLPDARVELVRGELRVTAPAGGPHPIRRTVMVVPADSPVRWLRETDLLEGDPVVPGFTCQVAEIFEEIARDA